MCEVLPFSEQAQPALHMHMLHRELTKKLQFTNLVNPKLVRVQPRTQASGAVCTGLATSVEGVKFVHLDNALRAPLNISAYSQNLNKRLIERLGFKKTEAEDAVKNRGQNCEGKARLIIS